MNTAVHSAPLATPLAIAKLTQSLTSSWTKCAGSSASFPPPVGSRKTPVRTRLEIHGPPASFAPRMSPLGLSARASFSDGMGGQQDVLPGLVVELDRKLAAGGRPRMVFGTTFYSRTMRVCVDRRLGRKRHSSPPTM